MNATAKVIPMHQPATNSAGVWAAFYGRLGLRVFPLKPKGKTPLLSKSAGGNGVHDATSDADQIAKWWTEYPTANIGLACGDGLVVFDVDGRNGGHETWAKTINDHGPPAAPFVATADGIHFYFADRAGIVRSKQLGDGVDVQSTGKYVVAPPSIHPTGKRYVWARNHGPQKTRGLPDIPKSLLAVLVPKSKTTTAKAAPTPKSSSGKPTRYGQKAMLGLIAEIKNAPVGQRHCTLFRCAARAGDLMREGHLDAESLFFPLVDAGLEVGGDKYSRDDIERTIRDAVCKRRDGVG